jgi:hypothetical protein
MYNNLTGLFSYMSFKGNVCFLVVYHYETNAILALPISGFCRLQTAIRTSGIKGVQNQIKPHGQPGKPDYKKISYPGAMQTNACQTPQPLSQCNQVRDSDIQGTFHQRPCNNGQQVPTTTVGLPHPPGENTLNMLRPSQIDPSKLAYKAIHGHYDWNRYPLASPGCKAVIYKSPESRGSWGSRGTMHGMWAHPSTTTNATISLCPRCGQIEFQVLQSCFRSIAKSHFFMWNEHLQEVINELVTTIQEMLPEKQASVKSIVN